MGKVWLGLRVEWRVRRRMENEVGLGGWWEVRVESGVSGDG